MALHVSLQHFLIVSAVLFSLGLFAVVTRRNAIMVLMGIELILNSANINFLAFSRYNGLQIDGQMAAIFVIILAAAEAAVGLAIVLDIFNHVTPVNVDEISAMQQ